MTPVFRMSLIILSLRMHFEPNCDCLSVRVSFVWESKAGFSMRALMNTQRCPLIWKGLTFRLLSFFYNFSFILSTIWSTIMLTCVPPFDVQMPFTKETCLNYPSERETTTCHRSVSTSGSLILCTPSSPVKYMSTYLRKELMGRSRSFKLTLTSGSRPAIS